METREEKQKRILEALKTVMITEMPILDKNKTGLPYDVWLDPAGQERRPGHNSRRIKIKINNVWVPFDIDSLQVPFSVKQYRNKKFPKQKEIEDWVLKYRDEIAKYWEQKYTEDEIKLILYIKDHPEIIYGKEKPNA